MAIDKKFINQFANVTQKAALAASYFIGKKDNDKTTKMVVNKLKELK